MKKISFVLSIYLAIFVLLVSCTNTPKTEINSDIISEISSEKEIVPKHNGILLDSKNAYAIEGVEIWTTKGKGGVFNEEGEIFCSWT